MNAGTFVEDCFDGQDNDCDGLADTEDDDCLELECTDGLDDDGDGLIDCDDPDCGIDPVCTEETCDDQQDEDLDGLIDCDDPDCAIATVCQQECVDMSTNDLGSAMGMGVAMGRTLVCWMILKENVRWVQPEKMLHTGGRRQWMRRIHSKPPVQLRYGSVYTRNLYDGAMGL